MACVFKIRINPQFNRAGNLKGVAAFKKQTEFTHTKIGVKVQPHQPSVLIVYPTQLLLFFFCLINLPRNAGDSTIKH